MVDLYPNFDFEKLKATVECGAPSNNINQFEGKMKISLEEGEEKEIALSIDNILLRGCHMRNTKRAYGLVAYTGHETKIMQNSSSK